MTNRITTYEELILEKHRLKVLLHGQREIIRQDIDAIKLELAPVKSAISFVGKLTTQEPGNPLINGTINTLIDFVLRKVVLARAGWLTKFAIPFIIKNYSSHFLDEKKDQIIRKVFSWFNKKKHKNGKGEYKDGKIVEAEVEEDEED